MTVDISAIQRTTIIKESEGRETTEVLCEIRMLSEPVFWEPTDRSINRRSRSSQGQSSIRLTTDHWGDELTRAGPAGDAHPAHGALNGAPGAHSTADKPCSRACRKPISHASKAASSSAPLLLSSGAPELHGAHQPRSRQRRWRQRGVESARQGLELADGGSSADSPLHSRAAVP